MNTIHMTHAATKAAVAILAAVVLSLALVSCDRDAHEGEYPLAAGQGGLVVGLQASSGAAVDALALYFFGGDGAVARCLAYDDPRALASEYIPVDAGTYTVVVVANVDGADRPEETTVADLTEWLKARADDYPDLLTAAFQTEIPEGEVCRLTATLEEGTSGIRLATVRLALAVPGDALPDYPSSRAADEGLPLRLVAEVYRAGTSERVHRRVQTCTPGADGTYRAELSLMPGEYDLRLWADRDGGYYNADDLNKVLVLTDHYAANGETDKKDAYYATASLSVADPGSPAGEGEGVDVALERPFARYRLVATDVEAYYNLMDKGEELPDIEDLQVRVTYEGFFPTGFNVETGMPNDALNTGVHYTSAPTAAEGYDAAVNRQVGADFVLTNGEESSLTVTIEMVDTRTGGTVATVRNVKIPYRRGHLTTVTGHFLTAGKTTGGVQIDTGWGDIVIEF